MIPAPRHLSQDVLQHVLHRVLPHHQSQAEAVEQLQNVIWLEIWRK
jgi:hypothetical protein